MEPTLTARLHVELDLEITDPEEVQAHARDWAARTAAGDQEALADMLEQAREGTEAALMMMVEASDVVEDIPGVVAVGATMWMDPIQGHDGGPDDGGPDDGGPDDGDDGSADGHLLGGLNDGGEEWTEDDWLDKFWLDAPKLPGLPLEWLGLDPGATDPHAAPGSTNAPLLLRGAIHWAYENLIDELFDDAALLRQDPDAVGETLQLLRLPVEYRDSYDALFAQRFLAVALDLGTALATDFSAPTCPAQAHALALILDGLDLVPQLLPQVTLPDGWRGPLEQAARVPAADVSEWFTPFPGCTVTPYAADAE